jgi:hypothetical protein
MRPPAGVGETGTLPARWRVVVPAAGWRGGMGIPLRTCSCGRGVDELGGAAETGEPGEDDEEVVPVSALPVLGFSCDSRVEVLLLCSVAVAWEKANGGEPVDDMLSPRGR